MHDSIISDIAKPFRFAQRHGVVRASYFLVHGLICRFGLERWIRLSISDIFSANISDLRSAGRVPSAFNISFAEEKDLLDIESFGRDREHCRARLKEGDVCLLLRLGSELKAMEWLAIGPREYWEDWAEMRTVFSIPQGSCFGYDGRGKAPGAWGLIMRTLPSRLEKIGVRTAYFRIDYANTLAEHSHRSAGYSPIGRVFHCGIAGIGFTLCRNGDGKWHRLPTKVRNLELAAPSNENVSRQFDLFPMYRKW